MKLLEQYKMNLIAQSRDECKRALLSLLEKDSQPHMLDLGSGDYTRTTLDIARYVNAKTITTLDIQGFTYSGVANDEFPFAHYVHDLNLPYEASWQYDIVVSSQVIEHLWNTDEFMRTVRRCLKPSGYAIIATPNLASWHNIAYLMLGRQPEVATVSNELYPWKEQPGHCRVFTATELLKLVAFHGFKVEKMVGSNYYPLSGKLARFLSSKDWKHSATITVKIRKET